MKWSSFLLFLVVVIFVPSRLVLAYDEDMHFYGTYAMARYAGIGRESRPRSRSTPSGWMKARYLLPCMCFQPYGEIRFDACFIFQAPRWPATSTHRKSIA